MEGEREGGGKGDREGGREGERERERVCVCLCAWVGGWVGARLDDPEGVHLALTLDVQRPPRHQADLRPPRLLYRAVCRRYVSSYDRPDHGSPGHTIEGAATQIAQACARVRGAPAICRVCGIRQ